ncbi:MAG: tetratricopeptide repeat protein, partial [Methylocella sp.]
MTADPDAASVHFKRGHGLKFKSQFEQAIEEYRKADELWRKDLSPKRVLALRYWANALREQKHYNEAAGKYREAIKIDPNYPWVYNGLG